MGKSIAEIGEEIYQRLKDRLEREHLGRIVAICDAGVASIGDEVDEVLDRALEKRPDKVFYVRKIGPCPAFHMF